MYSQSDVNKTMIILGSLSAFLTFFIVLWLVSNPSDFITNKLGIDHNILNPLGWILTLMIVVLYITMTLHNVPFIKDNVSRFSILKLIGIWAAIVAGFMKEFIFRKLIMDFLDYVNISVVIQVITASLVFGIVHAMWGILAGDLKLTLIIVISTSLLGLMLSLLYIFIDRNIFFPIITHISINLVIEPWLMLSVVSNNASAKS
ncbi:CPBP family glutamic-type intramembrane protease [Staphylococcus auricularis]|uniref:CPBP family glutamic-type intramembrane protease n=1 Tax=Staphylococcus auricularis TaxID=29379 RepID=UPI003EB91485